MSRIDIAELNDFLHGLRSSNAEAKAMINKIKEAATNYSQDSSLKGEAVTTSKQYFSSTYTSICQSIIEALDESEERLAQYIREFGSQVDSSPSARIDAEILQEAMAKVSQLQRKEEDLHRQLTATNTKPDMQQVYAVKSRSVHTQLLKAIEQENILEKYLAFEQSHDQLPGRRAEKLRRFSTGYGALKPLHFTGTARQNRFRPERTGPGSTGLLTEKSTRSAGENSRQAASDKLGEQPAYPANVCQMNLRWF